MTGFLSKTPSLWIIGRVFIAFEVFSIIPRNLDLQMIGTPWASWPSSYATACITCRGLLCESKFVLVFQPSCPEISITIRPLNPTRRKVSDSLPISDNDSQSECPVDFALLVRQYGSKAETTWERRGRGFYDTPLFGQLRAVARAMRISPTHPAVIIGTIDRGPQSASPASNAPTNARIVRNLALQAESSLDAILKTWELRRQQRGGVLELPPWMIVFGLLITSDGTVTIVAHFPDTDNMIEQHGSTPSETVSSIRFCSCIMDKIPFHPEIWWTRDLDYIRRWMGPTTDDAWISDRLRLILALLTLVTNSRLISAIWDDVDWPREVLNAEDVLEKQHAKWTSTTPAPSEDPRNENENENWVDLMALESVLGQTRVQEGSDSSGKSPKEQVALEANRLKVLEWRSAISPAFWTSLPKVNPDLSS